MKCLRCKKKTRVVRTEQIGKNIYRVRICLDCDVVTRTAESEWAKELSVVSDQLSEEPRSEDGSG
jgi:transcriptional regulator NrdR family protein